MEENTNKTYLQILEKEFAERRQRNPSYSLRAFARDLHMDPSLLCRYLKGKEIPGVRAGQRLVQELNLEQQVKEQFMESIVSLVR